MGLLDNREFYTKKLEEIYWREEEDRLYAMAHLIEGYMQPLLESCIMKYGGDGVCFDFGNSCPLYGDRNNSVWNDFIQQKIKMYLPSAQFHIGFLSFDKQWAEGDSFYYGSECYLIPVYDRSTKKMRKTYTSSNKKQLIVKYTRSKYEADDFHELNYWDNLISDSKDWSKKRELVENSVDFFEELKSLDKNHVNYLLNRYINPKLIEILLKMKHVRLQNTGNPIQIIEEYENFISSIPPYQEPTIDLSNFTKFEKRTKVGLGYYLYRDYDPMTKIVCSENILREDGSILYEKGSMIPYCGYYKGYSAYHLDISYYTKFNRNTNTNSFSYNESYMTGNINNLENMDFYFSPKKSSTYIEPLENSEIKTNIINLEKKDISKSGINLEKHKGMNLDKTE